MKSKTKWDELSSLTEEAIEKAAASDLDNPQLTEKELKAFKKVRPTEKIDIKRIRTELNLSQDKFALYFGVSKRTIQEWEQHRKKPSVASMNFLKVVEYAPEVVQRALGEN
jgi:DNA-binding transcriptional regulator YiaG